MLCLCAAEVRPLVGPAPMNKRRISLNLQKYPQYVLLSIAFVHILLFLGISPPSSTRLRAGSPPRWFDLRSSWRTSRDNARYLHLHQVHIIPLKYPELRAPGDALIAMVMATDGWADGWMNNNHCRMTSLCAIEGGDAMQTQRGSVYAHPPSLPPCLSLSLSRR